MSVGLYYMKGGAWYERIPGGYFTITWKGCDIVFSQYKNIEIYDQDTGAGKIIYNIINCEYSEELRPYRDEIIEMIYEGLNVFGVYYGRQDGVEVIVNIDPSIGSLNPNYNWDTQRIENYPVNNI